MFRPDLYRVWNALELCGYEPLKIRRDSFMARCPSHGGSDDRNASFWVRHDGTVGFCCHSRQCHQSRDGWEQMLSALDLVYSDFYGESTKRPARQASDDEAFCIVAESDLKAGKKLTTSQMEAFQIALLRRGGVAA